MAATTDHQGLYADAAIYDALHAPGTAQELDGIERFAALTNAPQGLWLEPACGSARLTRLAAARGRAIIGFDSEPGMVAYAQRRIRSARIQSRCRVKTGDMRTFMDQAVCKPASIAFAFNTINTFRHLMSDADALAHLSQVARALRPGGVYAVGISTCDYQCEVPTEDVWTAARGPVRVTQTVQFIPPTGPQGGSRIERVFSHLMIQRPSGEEHRDSTYALRTYNHDQWLSIIQRSPLRLADVADSDGRPDELPLSGYRLYALTRG